MHKCIALHTGMQFCASILRVGCASCALFDQSAGDAEHVVFGELVEGKAVAKAIGAAKTGANDAPAQPICVKRVVEV
jgi:cyclophilin family peptidyl-prolyl cis-trans isomerase